MSARAAHGGMAGPADDRVRAVSDQRPEAARPDPPLPTTPPSRPTESASAAAPRPPCRHLRVVPPRNALGERPVPPAPPRPVVLYFYRSLVLIPLLTFPPSSSRATALAPALDLDAVEESNSPLSVPLLRSRIEGTASARARTRRGCGASTCRTLVPQPSTSTGSNPPLRHHSANRRPRPLRLGAGRARQVGLGWPRPSAPPTWRSAAGRRSARDRLATASHLGGNTARRCRSDARHPPPRAGGQLPRARVLAAASHRTGCHQPPGVRSRSTFSPICASSAPAVIDRLLHRRPTSLTGGAPRASAVLARCSLCLTHPHRSTASPPPPPGSPRGPVRDHSRGRGAVATRPPPSSSIG